MNTRGYTTGHFGKWHIGPKDTEVDGMYGIDSDDVIGKSRDKEAGRDDDLYSGAIDFIRRNKSRPCYLNIWGHGTHFPVNSSDGLVAEYKDTKVNAADFAPTMLHKFDECVQIGGDLDDSMRQYLADVLQIDRNVVNVLQTIDELGLHDNTIVVFSSDHGPAPALLGKDKTHREFSNNMLGCAGELRGGKHQQ